MNQRIDRTYVQDIRNVKFETINKMILAENSPTILKCFLSVTQGGIIYSMNRFPEEMKEKTAS